MQALFSSRGLTVSRITPISGGIINTNMRVDCDDAAYLLRVYHSERSVEEIEFELSALRHITDAGLPAQRPVDPAGTGPARIDGHLCAILTFIEGEVLDEADLSREVSRQTGRLLGEMQNALAEFTPAGHKERCDVDFIDSLVEESTRLLREHGDDEFADWIAATWVRARAPFAADDLPLGLVHADLYPGNTIVRDGMIVGVIDFDDAYYGTQFFDVAIAAMEFAFRGDTELDVYFVREFLTAYEEVRGGVDDSLLLEAMLLNCFRFFGYTLPLTFQQDEPAAKNVYAQRIALFADEAFRRRMLDQLGRC
ncbi:Homoserine kinase [Micromonospora sp. MW-13]|nr:Homoserine kinase [Micromonospora sp. MW-13]